MGKEKINPHAEAEKAYAGFVLNLIGKEVREAMSARDKNNIGLDADESGQALRNIVTYINDYFQSSSREL